MAAMLPETRTMFFDEAHKRGTPLDGGLIFQTKRGTEIQLFTQGKPASPFMLKTYGDLATKHRWESRKPPTHGYNCAGHVLAGRRGEVECDKILQILREDGHRQLSDGEPPKPGDLVVYTFLATREPVHIGLIVQVRVLVQGIVGARPTPQVLSKMDAGSGEYLHEIEAVHYGNIGADYRVDYWTDRPLMGCPVDSQETRCTQP